EILVAGSSLPDAYEQALQALDRNGRIVDCPAWSTTCKEVAMTMVVNNPLQEPMVSLLGIHDPHSLQKYCMEMLNGLLDFRIGNGLPYTYHERYAWQMEFILKHLKEELTTRRACMMIRDLGDFALNDPPCLQHIQFLVRDGFLDMFVLFRSNDAVKATYMNAFALIGLQKKVADKLGVEMGTYTHRANSFHCYERDLPMLDGYVKRIQSREPCAVNYRGEWDDLMRAEIPVIRAEVERMKEVGK
ncbi:MAG: thymidylate synthase, partial [Oscillospiraceae bacterium]|nr:thymidylate synthase [Oscillospiraceae bacterium]